MVRSSTQPSSRSRWTKAPVHWLMAEPVPAPKNPIVGGFAECCALAASGHAANERDEVAPFHCPMPSRASDRKDSTPRYGRLLHPSSWAERDDRDHAAENFFQGGSPKTGHPISPPGPPHRQKSFLTKFPGMGPG